MTEEGTPQEPQGQDIPPEVVAPEPLTMEAVQALLDKRDARMQTWLGRRDADLIEKIKTTAIPKKTPDEERDKMLEDPDGFFERKQIELQTRESQRMQNILLGAGNIMERDPLFEDSEFGNEVVEEIKKIAPTIQRNMDPGTAAEMLVQKAALAVTRRKRLTKKNPFDGREPKKDLGNASPPATGGKKAPKPKIESDLAAKMAKKWGYDDKKLAELFPNE